MSIEEQIAILDRAQRWIMEVTIAWDTGDTCPSENEGKDIQVELLDLIGHLKGKRFE